MVESGSEVKLVQWVQAMEAVWTGTHNRLRLQEEKSLRAWGPMTEDGDEDRLWAKVSEMLTETCSRPEGFNPKPWAEQCWSAAKLIQEWIYRSAYARGIRQACNRSASEASWGVPVRGTGA